MGWLEDAAIATCYKVFTKEDKSTGSESGRASPRLDPQRLTSSS